MLIHATFAALAATAALSAPDRLAAPATNLHADAGLGAARGASLLIHPTFYPVRNVCELGPADMFGGWRQFGGCASLAAADAGRPHATAARVAAASP